MGQPLRILYDAGPGDVLRSVQSFAAGRLNPDISHVGYSDQFCRVCAKLDIPALVVTSHPAAQPFEAGPIHLEPKPNPMAAARGAAYYAAQLQRSAQLLRDAHAFGANVLIAGNEPHPMLLAPARRMGIQVIQSLHCVLWPEWKPLRPRQRLLVQAMRGAYRHGLCAALSVSGAVSAQVERVAHGPCIPIVEFLPTFRPEMFSGMPSPLDIPNRPFRVIFFGRLEANKGVFELIEIARRLRDGGEHDVVFDLCGDGSAMTEARARVEAHDLGRNVHLHGWCDAKRLRELAASSHVVIVPTTSDFIEGFNKTVVEGLLYGRPVITSEVCPATRYVWDALIVVGADDVDGYERSIVQLLTDRSRYARLCQRARRVGEKFLGDRYSYARALEHVLSALQRGQRPQSLRLSEALCQRRPTLSSPRVGVPARHGPPIHPRP